MTAARMVELELESIPQLLRSEARWVLWKTEDRDGKLTKVPYQAQAPDRRAKSNDPATWATFNVAVEALEASDAAGIGFVLGDGWAGVDLDGVDSAESDALHPTIQHIIEKIGGYAEKSPGGNGIHIIFKGRLPSGPRRFNNLASWCDHTEIYDEARFFTVTGQVLFPGNLAQDRSSKLVLIHAELDLENFKGQMGNKANKLAGGDISDYTSHSEADLALSSYLLRYTNGDKHRASRLFRVSGLYRDKWDKRHGADGQTYGELTLHKAASGAFAGTAPGRNGSHQDGAARFFGDKGTFIPKRLAEELLNEHDVAYAADEHWIYRGGVYRPGGDRILSREAQHKLGEHTRRNRVSEALFYIATKTATDLPDHPEGRYLNTRSGRVDWMTGEVHEHDPSTFEITQIPVEYDPNAGCTEWDRYLQTTLDESLHPLVEEFIGYCLIPYTGFEKAVMLTGVGDNGKSVLLDTITALLGDENTAHEPLQNLEHNRFAPAKLVGKLANIFADIPHERLERSSMFKTLVTGDRITAEQKHKDPFEFRPWATLLFSANELPATADKTPAFFKRWLLIPFERQFTVGDPDRDPELRSKLTRPSELSGILNRAIQGLHRLFEQGHFTEPQIVKDAIAEYEKASDTVRAFVDECCIIDTNARVSKQEFYDAYSSWCERNGHYPVSQRTLKDRVFQIAPTVSEGQPTINGRQRRSWLGLGLLEDEAE